MNDLNKLTKILMNNEATDFMVESFNFANCDLIKLNEKELNLVKENLRKIIAAADDLNRTIDEEMNMKEISSLNTVDNFFADCFKYAEQEKEVKKAINNSPKEKIEVEFSKKEEKIEKEVPELIAKAVELVRKYNLGIPFLENGTIIELYKAGERTLEDDLDRIFELFKDTVESGIMSNKDVKDIAELLISTIPAEVKLEIEENLQNELKDIDELLSELIAPSSDKDDEDEDEEDETANMISDVIASILEEDRNKNKKRCEVPEIIKHMGYISKKYNLGYDLYDRGIMEELYRVGNGQLHIDVRHISNIYKELLRNNVVSSKDGDDMIRILAGAMLSETQKKDLKKINPDISKSLEQLLSDVIKGI